MTNGLSLEELMKEGTYPEEYASLISGIMKIDKQNFSSVYANLKVSPKGLT